MAAKRTSSVGQKVAMATVAVVALVGVLTVGRVVTADRRTEFCTLAASGGGTLRSTPEAAFDDWWDGQFPDGPDPDDADVDRDGTVWRVHEDQEAGHWTKVEVGHPFDLPPAGSPPAYEDPADLGSDGWTVTGANRCGGS